MKATTRVGLVPILVGLMVLLSFPGLTGADGGGANVVRGEDCTISLAELGGDEVTTTDTQSVETPSGNVSLVCRADLPDGLDPPRRALRTSGELCETPLGPTTDTTKVMTPSGRVRLTCRVMNKARKATGWAVGDSVDGYSAIIHTTDGGQTWVRQGKAGEVPDATLQRVSAADAQNAWAVGDQNDNSYGVILHTRDGGRTWQRQEMPAEVSDAGLIGVYALDGDTAWATGIHGLILHTTDGGQTWIQQGRGAVPDVDLGAVYASDADHAWVIGDSEGDNTYGTILRTVDGGATWVQKLYTLPPGRNGYGLIDVHGVDANTVWAAGGDRQIMHTADGGLTWVSQHPGGQGMADQNGVFAVDRRTLWVVADYGNIIRSDDGGATWARQGIQGFRDYVMRISAVNKRAAWAATVIQTSPLFKGHMLHTADGGETWTIQATPVETNWWGVSFVR